MGFLIEAEGLVKVFGRTVALDGLDLRLGAGEIVGFLGPNGAGKTTLIKVLATLLQPTAGSVRVLDLDLRRERDAIRSQIGVILHGFHLYEELTALENLRFVAAMRGLPLEDGALIKALAEVGLEGLEGDRVRSFSTGMRRRLGVAKVLLQGPRLLLLDEPHTGLDQEAIGILDRLLLATKERGGLAILATHNLSRAFGICGRFLILVEGRVAWTGGKDGLTADGLRAVYAAEVEGVGRCG